MSGPFPVGLGLWGPVLLAGLGLGFAVFGLIRPRGLAGLLALLLAAVTAGAGVAAQVRAEREVDGFLTSAGLSDNRAQLERIRLYRYPHAQSLGRKVAVAALLPLLLGAVAALRRPLGSRALALGFLALAVLAWGAAWHISHRALPVDRYDFPEGDVDAWLLAIAIAIDDVHERSSFGSERERECDSFDLALRQASKARPIPPVLEAASAVAASRCVRATLAALEATRDPEVASRFRRALLDSVSLQDEAVRTQLERAPAPAPAPGAGERRRRAGERIRAIFGAGVSTSALEEVLAHADAGVP